MAPSSAKSSNERKIPSPPGYQLGRVLGQGGMGVVYLGKQLSLNRKVAIKVLHPQFTQVVHVKRLLREGRALATLRHNNILSVIDFIQDKGRIYLVMEYIQGVPLSKVIQKLKTAKRPTASAFKKCCKGGNDWNYPDHHYFDLIRQIFIDLAKGMGHAHENKILHRDIKPSNIMITPSGKPFLLDFGLSTVSNEVTLTSPQEILGTPLYMAPEQIEGEQLNPCTDIYSLGATLYQTLGLKTAHHATSQVALLHSVVNKEPKPINQINPHLPKDFTKIVSKSMAKKPEDRYQSMQELVEDLEALHFSDGPKEAGPVYIPQSSGGIMPWIYLLASLILMGLGFWWFINQPQKAHQQDQTPSEQVATADPKEEEKEAWPEEKELPFIKITEATHGTFKDIKDDMTIIVEGEDSNIYTAQLAHLNIGPKVQPLLKKHLKTNLIGKEVLLKPTSFDPNSNLVEVYHNGFIVNISLVGSGLARVQPGMKVPKRYREKEREAQMNQRGIWNPSNNSQEGLPKRNFNQMKEKLR